ncbi:hypothetical protein PCYB_051010 [Plasmodium cynomolgi strain B]|uniref:CYIR protein n=1 Tax=Plasmodium cynomolgi (strain B) TaxID=1120755 RepID=K6UIK8_PLACD|nr:hypothetical protein PCYB_051010 [Plasmodium cynomolgi strain B]GAB65083.1 hypothetical protein PCYB_051010 [Plasmodium cynomolgi strain B]
MGHVTVSFYAPKTDLTDTICLEKYLNILGDAKNKIKELFPELSTNLSEECAAFKKYLEGEKGKLKECYQKTLLPFFLDNDVDLKNTIQKCTNNFQNARNSVDQDKPKGERKKIVVQELQHQKSKQN